VILSVIAIDSQSVRVTWREPTQPNGVLINYTIRYTTDDKTSEVTVSYHGNVSISIVSFPITVLYVTYEHAKIHDHY